jgi:hypothetical protein
MQEAMVISNSNNKGPDDKYFWSYLDNIVVIPSPVLPRRVGCGPLAKVLDFLAWKNSHTREGDESANKTLEQVMKLSIAKQQLWAIRTIFEMYDRGNRKDFYKLYEILCERSTDPA